MVESENDDGFNRLDREHDVYKKNNSNLGSLLLVALIPIAFFAGWIANANTNPQGNGFEAGVGGGPDNTSNERQVSPTEPQREVTATPTTTPTPSIELSPTVTEDK